MTVTALAPPQSAAPPDSLLRLPEVVRRTGLSKSAVYQLIRDNRFPAPLPLYGQRARAWAESEVSVWIAERIANARCAAGVRA